MNFSILSQFTSPAEDPGDLAWDGKFLWHVDGKSNKVYKINPKNGTITSVYDSPCKGGTGIEIVNEYLWLTDWITGIVYCYDYKKSNIILKKNMRAVSESLVGIAWDGNYMWLGDCKEKKIYKLNTETCDILSDFNISNDIAGITSDHKSFLYYINYKEQKLIQLQLSDSKIVKSIPLNKDICGICWDGLHFWFVDYKEKRIFSAQAFL